MLTLRTLHVRSNSGYSVCPIMLSATDTLGAPSKPLLSTPAPAPVLACPAYGTSGHTFAGHETSSFGPRACELVKGAGAGGAGARCPMRETSVLWAGWTNGRPHTFFFRSSRRQQRGKEILSRKNSYNGDVPEYITHINATSTFHFDDTDGGVGRCHVRHLGWPTG